MYIHMCASLDICMEEIEIMLRFGFPGPDQLPGVARSFGAGLRRTQIGWGLRIPETETPTRALSRHVEHIHSYVERY